MKKIIAIAMICSYSFGNDGYMCNYHLAEGNRNTLKATAFFENGDTFSGRLYKKDALRNMISASIDCQGFLDKPEIDKIKSIIKRLR